MTWGAIPWLFPQASCLNSVSLLFALASSLTSHSKPSTYIVSTELSMLGGLGMIANSDCRASRHCCPYPSRTNGLSMPCDAKVSGECLASFLCHSGVTWKGLSILNGFWEIFQLCFFFFWLNKSEHYLGRFSMNMSTYKCTHLHMHAHIQFFCYVDLYIFYW